MVRPFTRDGGPQAASRPRSRASLPGRPFATETHWYPDENGTSVMFVLPVRRPVGAVMALVFQAELSRLKDAASPRGADRVASSE